MNIKLTGMLHCFDRSWINSGPKSPLMPMNSISINENKEKNCKRVEAVFIDLKRLLTVI